MSGVFENQVRPARLEQASKGERVGDEVGEVGGARSGRPCLLWQDFEFYFECDRTHGGRVGAEEGRDLNCVRTDEWGTSREAGRPIRSHLSSPSKRWQWLISYTPEI